MTLPGLNGSGEHEVQGAAIYLGPGHGRPGRMREGQHPVPPAGSKRVSYKTGTAGAREASDHNEHRNAANLDVSTEFLIKKIQDENCCDFGIMLVNYHTFW